MASTFTANVGLEEPARGDQVGTWDTPVNNNMTLIDLILGGVTTIPLAGAGVVLSAAQFKSKTITFNSTLTASVTITFPTSFIKSYEIQNLTTGTSAFTVTLATTAAGGAVIALPPGEFIDVVNDGTNIKFKNLGRVGAYWDHAGSSLPNWVSACTVPPYLNCDGTAFSSATYPQLATIIGGTTLPDSRGRSRFALDQGAGRISSGSVAFTGSSVGSGGGVQTTTLGTSNLPAYTPSVASNTLTIPIQGSYYSPGVAVSVSAALGVNNSATVNLGVAGTITMNSQGGVSQVLTNLPPALIGGLTMIRAA